MAEPGRMDVISAILDLKNRDPFAPFTIVLTSGLSEAAGDVPLASCMATWT